MKKSLKKLMALSLAVIMILACSSPAFAAKKADSASSAAKIREVSTEVIEISREEFLNNLAKQNGISFAEADRIDKAQTLADYQKELSKHHTLSRSLTRTVSPMKTVYTKVRKRFSTGYSGAFRSEVTTVINVKLEQYDSPSYGSYKKFAEVLDLGSSASCSGSYTWNVTAQSATITDDYGYGNKIVMMVAGVIETGISASLQASAEKAGFSGGISAGGTYIFRKDVDLDYTFSSNY